MINLPKDHTANHLFVTLIHEIQKKFSQHAILKGGMVLTLLGSARRTVDLDYTFVHFKSKKDVLDDLKNLCESIDGATTKISVNSKAIRLIVKTQNTEAQIEVNVSEKCKSIPISTKMLSDKVGIPAKLISIMSYDISLANKLAAWFERRLMRDLYDIHFLFTVAGATIDEETFNYRINHIESRIPLLKKVKKISRIFFFEELHKTADELTDAMFRAELVGVIEEIELFEISKKVKLSILKLIERN